MSLIEKAIETVVKLLPDKPADPLMGAHRTVGQPVSRLDGPLKVIGTARFTAEVTFDELLFASLACSTIARGRIRSIDTVAARQVMGVVDVMTHENCPRMEAPPAMVRDPNGAAMSDLPVMQDDSVRWNGQPVAVVLAETQEAADHAATLVVVEYEPGDADLAFEAMIPDAQMPKNVLGQPPEVSRGDAEAALEKSATRVDEIYRTPRHYNSAIELHVTTAHWEADDALVIHDASQTLQASRYTIAKAFSLSPDSVRILAPFVGGAFGSKGVWNHTLLCVAAAKLLGRPVRLMLSREDVFRETGGRTLTEQRVALGANPDGTLAALIHTGTTAVTSHNSFPEQFTFPAKHLYATENLYLQQKVVLLDMVANTAMRAPGESVGSFALESALDELGHALGVDPVELRRRVEPTRDPEKDTEFSSRHLLEAYRRGAERFGWSKRNAVTRSQRDGEWLIGHGVATATYPYYRRPASAQLRLGDDGHVVIRAAAHEMGMGTATVQAQHAAERLGLPLTRVRFEYGDTAMPKSPLAGGSCQSASIAAAILAVCSTLVEDLLAIAADDSPLAGAGADEVEARDGGLYLKAAPDRGERYEDLLHRAGQIFIQCDADAPAPTEILKYSMHSYGAQFCEVRVSAITGEVRVTRWLGSFDTGRILNPKTARSQFRGGIIMGIGMALMEDALFDERSGRFMNPSLAEYHVPVHMDIPEIDVIWNDIPDPHTPLGLHGIGEIGITGVAAAIANAVFNATGIRVRELPITLDKLLAAGIGEH